LHLLSLKLLHEPNLLHPLIRIDHSHRRIKTGWSTTE
jgi:hypothetical protein